MKVGGGEGDLCSHKPLIKGNFQNVGIMVPDFMSGIPSVLAFISPLSPATGVGITHVYSQELSGGYRVRGLTEPPGRI